MCAVSAAEQARAEQLAIYRRMSPERRLALAQELWWTARELKAAWLRHQHPDWPQTRVWQEVARIFSNART